MVVPPVVKAAVDVGDRAVVQAWLDRCDPGAVNDRCGDGYTCIHRSMNLYGPIQPQHVDLARFLISRGADVNLCGLDNWAPLHLACFWTGSAEMVSLLLQAGAGSVLETRTTDPGQSVYPDSTPLGILLHSFRDRDIEDEDDMSNFQESLVALLRAGASLCSNDEDKSAINIMRGHLVNDRTLADDDDYIKCREILAGVREHGSYKRYLRAPHREFLRFRSLLVRGRAKTNELHERIARLPNGACWKVLSYWREDN